MKSFTFLQPDDLDGARQALAEWGADAVPMSGGQTLLLQLKSRAVCPRAVVHVGRIPELQGTAVVDGVLHLGAATTYSALEDGPRLPGAADMVRAVSADLADRAVRNLGTIGGAVTAADPAFDMPVALTALDAKLALRSNKDERVIDMDDFLLGAHRTDRAPEELLEEILIPCDDGTAWAFEKFRQRLADAAVASVAVVRRERSAEAHPSWHVVVGAVTDRPIQVSAAEELLNAGDLSDSTIRDAAQLVAEQVIHRRQTHASSAPYLLELLGTLTRRALMKIRTNGSEVPADAERHDDYQRPGGQRQRR